MHAQTHNTTPLNPIPFSGGRSRTRTDSGGFSFGGAAKARLVGSSQHTPTLHTPHTHTVLPQTSKASIITPLQTLPTHQPPSTRSRAYVHSLQRPPSKLLGCAGSQGRAPNNRHGSSSSRRDGASAGLLDDGTLVYHGQPCRSACSENSASNISLDCTAPLSPFKSACHTAS